MTSPDTRTIPFDVSRFVDPNGQILIDLMVSVLDEKSWHMLEDFAHWEILPDRRRTLEEETDDIRELRARWVKAYGFELRVITDLSNERRKASRGL